MSGQLVLHSGGWEATKADLGKRLKSGVRPLPGSGTIDVGPERC
jgi:hypothetical protein